MLEPARTITWPFPKTIEKGYELSRPRQFLAGAFKSKASHFVTKPFYIEINFSLRKNIFFLMFKEPIDFLQRFLSFTAQMVEE